MFRIIPLGMMMWGIGCAGAVAATGETPGPASAAEAESAPEIPVPTDLPTGPPDATGAVSTGSQNPAPGLDTLLTLPGDRTYTVERRGGLSQGEWGARFGEARAALAKEQTALDAAEARMDRAAESGQWQVAPPLPGQQNTGAPAETTLDFKTRQEIRRHREEIERLERRLREIEIEANLAAVPAEWRH